MAELSRRILIGRHYKTFTDPETAERIRQIYENIYKTGIPAKNVIFEVIDKHGRRRTVDQSVSLIRNTEGVITGFRNVSLDITARKEAENKLTEHRSRLGAIFRSVKDAIITVDPNLIVIEANKSMENICGTEVEEIVGKEFPQCQQHCNQACHEVLGQTLEKKTAIKEYRIECENQHRLQQRIQFSPS